MNSAASGKVGKKRGSLQPQVSRRRDPRPRREPRQERARQTVAAILEAAALVFPELGYSRATTDKIAARAGVSVGSLYQYFPDKEALVRALIERHHAEVHRVVDAARGRLSDPSVPLPEGLRCLLDGLVRLHADDPGLSRFLGEVTPAAAWHTAHRREEGERYVLEFERVLRARPEVRVPDERIAATVLVRTVEALTRWLVHEAPPGLDAGAFVDETIRMLESYLFETPSTIASE